MSTQTFAANKKAAYGRVGADKKLYAFNKELKYQSMKERTYWEVNKDVHPINRWWWLRWSKKIRQESMFTERVNSTPVDQRYKLKKLLEMPSKATLILPTVMAFYVAYAFIRYKLFGTTPAEVGAGTSRFVSMLPKAPGLNT